jgi:hypothetical protein
MSIDPVIATILQFGVAALFVVAAVHKTMGMRDFRGVLAMYRLLPEQLVTPAAWCIAASEAVIGAGVLLRERVGYVAAGTLLLGYAVAMGINLARGRRFIDCGCGGATQPLSWGLVARNALLSAAALLGLVPVSARPVGWMDVVSMAAGVLVVGLLYAAINQVLAARARLEEWV